MKKELIMKNIFREKPVNILIALYNGPERLFISKLSKITDCTYPHVSKIIHFMKDQQIVNLYKEGRTKYIRLTPKGLIIAENLNDIEKEL